ncbi:FAR-17a/AIG1-like protein [Fusarium tricinctum]|uniref:FAR-17a/AIG1-like protein n=2 Tax=Fusarium tricinctum species complex TaxID=679429 RepID=A0A8K0RL22_9HYPO|nr:FAR-17a/AIG1-like protein [Fusarium tricinctum]
MAPTQNTSASLRTRTLKTGFHALGTSSFAYSFYLLTTWESSYSDSFGWYFQLLTVVGLATSLVTFSLGLAADLTLKDVFSRAKNATSVLATPLEVLIAVLYWSIRMHDPALLMPEDLVIDPLPDLGFHLVPAVLLVLDFLLLSRGATITTRGMMLLSTVLAVVYWCWIELCFYQNGWYPYPMMDKFSATQRVTIFVASAGLLTLSSSALQWIHGKIHSSVTKKGRVD